MLLRTLESHGTNQIGRQANMTYSCQNTEKGVRPRGNLTENLCMGNYVLGDRVQG